MIKVKHPPFAYALGYFSLSGEGGCLDIYVCMYIVMLGYRCFWSRPSVGARVYWCKAFGVEVGQYDLVHEQDCSIV